MRLEDTISEGFPRAEHASALGPPALPSHSWAAVSAKSLILNENEDLRFADGLKS
jgi:hypothetical protein